MTDVEHEHDGAARQGGHVGGRREAVVTDAPVEEPHDPLDDGDVGRPVGPGPVQQQRLDERLVGEEGVEVAARPPGRERVVPGVDEVGADLEPAHGEALPAQRGHQPRRDGRLAVAGCRGGHDDPWQALGHHSMPR